MICRCRICSPLCINRKLSSVVVSATQGQVLMCGDEQMQQRDYKELIYHDEKQLATSYRGRHQAGCDGHALLLEVCILYGRNTLYYVRIYIYIYRLRWCTLDLIQATNFSRERQNNRSRNRIIERDERWVQ